MQINRMSRIWDNKGLRAITCTGEQGRLDEGRWIA